MYSQQCENGIPCTGTIEKTTPTSRNELLKFRQQHRLTRTLIDLLSMMRRRITELQRRTFQPTFIVTNPGAHTNLEACFPAFRDPRLQFQYHRNSKISHDKKKRSTYPRYKAYENSLTSYGQNRVKKL
ncbi:uncharacterized protein LOC143209796 [Lasioglossum baleicum]|uniref:uncharacterized protein LOC143209796 n=1 Tax=Lasioglossum baleicum TaxID=434251 RepID=UPI003FCE0F27